MAYTFCMVPEPRSRVMRRSCPKSAMAMLFFSASGCGRCNDQDQLVFKEGLLLHSSMGDSGTYESEVTLGGADHVGDVASVSDFDGGLDGGMEGNEAGEEAGENELAGDGACSQGEPATDLAG